MSYASADESSQQGQVERMMRIEGVLDANSAHLVRRELDEILADNPHRLVVDASELRLIDSTGIGALVNAFKQLRQRGGRLIVTGLRDQPLAMFRLLRLDRVLMG